MRRRDPSKANKGDQSLRMTTPATVTTSDQIIRWERISIGGTSPTALK